MDIDTMPAGREMDALIAEKVMGSSRHEWIELYPTEATDYCRKCGTTKRRGEIFPNDGDFCNHAPENYSGDIAAVWRVVELFRRGTVPGHQFAACCMDLHLSDATSDEDWDCNFFSPGLAEHPATGDSAPLAICRAALKAIEK